ncbi:MAG: sucrase ferredoxin [Phenylobacterium sp.]
MIFCSRLSEAAHEPFAGTGVQARAYVFLPVAKRLWQDREMNRLWASPEELAAINAARQAGVVTRLYNPEAQDAAVLVHGQAAGLAPLLEAFGRRWPIDATGGQRLAICTHGTRDRCCAKFGFAAFQAARRLFAAGLSEFAPLECSHLGGDRFAATGIFFPSGSMYAHLDTIDLAALCAEEAAGRLDPTHYRGRVFEPPLAQVVRAGLARAGLVNDAATPIAVTDEAGAVEAQMGAARYRVRLGVAEVEFFGSCSAVEAAKPSRGKRRVFDTAVAI